MYIAQSKRKENIAEYILYLWQIEDLLRAMQFSPEAVYTKLVQPRDLDPDKQQELLMWYMDIANLLREEGKEESGHLDHTLHLIKELQSLHLQLLKSSAGARYRTLFAALEPELPRLREIMAAGKKEEDRDIEDIELCFRALYAAMLYNIKGGEKGDKVSRDVLAVVSPVIAELADAFRRVESGELDLYK